MTTATFLTPTYLRIDLLRELRNTYVIVFSVGMPTAMYILFGTGAGIADQSVGNANAAYYVAISMACYGTASTMAALGARASSEISQGWGRQLAMTPLTIGGYVTTKLISALVVAAASLAIVMTVAFSTAAKVDSLDVVVQGIAMALGGGVLFGLMGMGVGMFLRPDAAASVASIAVTFFSFFGNVFMPLEGVMLDIARFTPMYGYVALVRYPATEGALVTGGTDELWMLALNAAAWTVVFLAMTVVGIRRARARR